MRTWTWRQCGTGPKSIDPAGCSILWNTENRVTNNVCDLQSWKREATASISLVQIWSYLRFSVWMTTTSTELSWRFRSKEKGERPRYLSEPLVVSRTENDRDLSMNRRNTRDHGLILFRPHPGCVFMLRCISAYLQIVSIRPAWTRCVSAVYPVSRRPAVIHFFCSR
jgi:hypothetical protein